MSTEWETEMCGKAIKLIRKNVDLDALKMQMIEELGELVQALAKEARAKGNGNPTPITAKQAHQNVRDEFHDVMIVAAVLHWIPYEPWMLNRLDRWVHRIMENKKDE